MAQAIEGGSAETKNPQPQSGGVFNQLVGTALGLVLQGSNDRRQRRMNQALINQQIEGGKRMGIFNQQLALDTWEKTNYAAQVEQMKKAGLNPGLMYGSAGAGGQTGPGAAMPSSSSAPVGGGEIGMGIQTAAHLQQLAAQTENIRASTENIKADTAKKAGVDTAKTATEIENIAQQTKNAKINEALLNYQEQITQIEQRIKAKTEQDIVTSVRQANEKTEAEIRSAQVGADVSEATKNDIIQQLKTYTQIQSIRLQAEKQGLIKTGAEINQINANIKNLINQLNLNNEQNFREWQKLGQQERETRVREAMQKLAATQTAFNTSDAAQYAQWTHILTGMLGPVSGGEFHIK